MIMDLNPRHGIEVWLNQKLAEEIENCFKMVLKTEELYYYYIPCSCHKKSSISEHKSEVKWAGKIKLIDFIKKIQKNNSHFCPIGVTNAKNKKDLLYFFDHNFHSIDNNIPHWDYWIGDVKYDEMICGDQLFIELWNRIKDKKTSGSKTERKFG